jgi:hypothetical protein
VHGHRPQDCQPQPGNCRHELSRQECDCGKLNALGLAPGPGESICMRGGWVEKSSSLFCGLALLRTQWEPWPSISCQPSISLSYVAAVLPPPGSLPECDPPKTYLGPFIPLEYKQVLQILLSVAMSPSQPAEAERMLPDSHCPSPALRH